jgi:putative membrane protein insertion efficiency factor
MEQNIAVKRKLINLFFCLPIRAYQVFISPILGPRCRFYPSCSTYACEAIVHFGPLKGIWLTLRRLLRCHPWHEGGYDPILPKPKKENH